MDESGSITTADFTRQKDFVAALANGFNNFGPNGVQMGVITFSTYANVDIKLRQFPNKAAFMNAVRNIRQRGETLLRKKKTVQFFVITVVICNFESVNAVQCRTSLNALLLGLNLE